jgi:flavorubredoxin
MEPNTATTAVDVEAGELDVAEVVPSRLYVFGPRIPLDERISWAWPDVWGGLQPMNGYLLIEDDAALIVDPGPAFGAELVERQLRSILPAGSPVSIFMTRSEFDTFGALPRIAETYAIQHLFAGGYINLLDGYSSIAKVDTAGSTEHVSLERVGTGGTLPIAEGRYVLVVRPAFRMITSYWLFDQATGALFTSDAFGHGTTPSMSDPRVLADGAAFDPAEIRHYLFTKFWWLAHAGANTALIAADLREFFDHHDVTAIAPQRGYVIQGAQQVRDHVQLVLDALADVASGADRSGS